MTQHLSPKSHFFILGAPKCGTTTFAYLLGQHPAIMLSQPKEAGFFDNDELYSRGVHYYARTCFRGSHPGMLTADATPTYLAGDQRVISRVAGFYAGAAPRFIILVRDPVDRLWSHYLHLRRLMVEERDFLDAISDDLSLSDGQQTYVRHSHVGGNLARWLETFPCRDYYLLDTIETLRDAQNELLHKTYSFLGIDPPLGGVRSACLNRATFPRFPELMRRLNDDGAFKRLAQRLLNPLARRRLVMRLQDALLYTPEKADLPALEPSVRRELAVHFRQDLELFVKLTGCDISTWPSVASAREHRDGGRSVSRPETK